MKAESTMFHELRTLTLLFCSSWFVAAEIRLQLPKNEDFLSFPLKLVILGISVGFDMLLYLNDMHDRRNVDNVWSWLNRDSNVISFRITKK